MEIQEAIQGNSHDFFRLIGRGSLVLSAAAVLFAITIMFVSNAVIVYAGPVGRRVEIRVLSSPPDMVSGGKALVEIRMSGSIVTRDIRLTLNGKVVTDDFHSQSDGTLLGLAQGMVLGENHFAVLTKESHWRSAAALEIINHPISGPIFSGPHQSPYICETTTFVLPVTGGTLGPPLDADCSIATRVDYVYKSTDGKFKPLADPSVHPADLSQAMTTEGRTVNYIVRIETGTINRAIYQIAILYDPATGSAPSPLSRLAGWNGRLIYTFGGGCAPGYHQGSAVAGPLNDLWLSKGYAAASSTLNVFGNNCNDVISAETMMMVKENFIKEYGVPRYTIGWGQSGGAMQQNLISANYPGLLDGITPSLNFADSITYFIPIADCPLLTRVFDSSTNAWTTEQKAAVSGWGAWDFCTDHSTADWSALTRAGLNPQIEVTGCRASVPRRLIYDPVTNPTGARCTWFDNLVNIFGTDPKTGKARRALDNVGVQYGLKAFNAGQISAEQFIELNDRIGSYDPDGNIVSGRMAADPEALRIAYASGRVNEAKALGSVPIIDYRPYRDMIADVHDSVRSRIMRARLIAANGNASNQVIFVSPLNTAPSGAAIFASVTSEVLNWMEQWLDHISRDSSPYKTLNEKVVRNKPAGLVDSCYGAEGEKISDPGKCSALYPVHGNPRLAAGQPLSNDILKCQLTAVDAKAYGQPLTGEQIQRLKAAFPNGVCDYNRPGVGQEKHQETWLAYPQPGYFESTGEAKRAAAYEKASR